MRNPELEECIKTVGRQVARFADQPTGVEMPNRPKLDIHDYARNLIWDERGFWVAEGDAAWISSWEDSQTGARALVSIEAGHPRLNVVFESAEFIAWVEDAERVTEPGP